MINDKKFINAGQEGADTTFNQRGFDRGDLAGIADKKKWGLKHLSDRVHGRSKPSAGDPMPSGTLVEFNTPDGTTYRGKVASKSGDDYIVEVTEGESYLVPPGKLAKVTAETERVRELLRREYIADLSRVAENYNPTGNLVVRVAYIARRPSDDQLRAWAEQHYPDLRLVDVVAGMTGREVGLVFEVKAADLPELQGKFTYYVHNDVDDSEWEVGFDASSLKETRDFGGGVQFYEARNIATGETLPHEEFIKKYNLDLRKMESQALEQAGDEESSREESHREYSPEDDYKGAAPTKPQGTAPEMPGERGIGLSSEEMQGTGKFGKLLKRASTSNSIIGAAKLLAKAGGWVCGGVVRDIIAGKQPRDIDLFIPVADVDVWKSALSKAGFKKVHRRFIAGDVIIDIVPTNKKSAAEVVSGFDIDVCQWYLSPTGKPISLNKAVYTATEALTPSVVGDDQFGSTDRRLAKLAEAGWKVADVVADPNRSIGKAPQPGWKSIDPQGYDDIWEKKHTFKDFEVEVNDWSAPGSTYGNPKKKKVKIPAGSYSVQVERRYGKVDAWVIAPQDSFQIVDKRVEDAQDPTQAISDVMDDVETFASGSGSTESVSETEEECPSCKRKKDKGQPCWWCGATSESTSQMKTGPSSAWPSGTYSDTEGSRQAQLQKGQPGYAEQWADLEKAARWIVARFNDSNPEYYALPLETETAMQGDTRVLRLSFTLNHKSAEDELEHLYISKGGTLVPETHKSQGDQHAGGFVQVDSEANLPMVMLNGPTGPQAIQQYGFNLFARKTAEYEAAREMADTVLAQYGGYSASAQADFESRLTKLAVDPTTKKYWQSYFGEYGRMQTRNIPRKKHKTASIDKTAVDEMTKKYWSDYFGSGSRSQDRWYGDAMTADVPRRSFGDSTHTTSVPKDTGGVLDNRRNEDSVEEVKDDEEPKKKAERRLKQIETFKRMSILACADHGKTVEPSFHLKVASIMIDLLETNHIKIAQRELSQEYQQLQSAKDFFEMVVRWKDKPIMAEAINRALIDFLVQKPEWLNSPEVSPEWKGQILAAAIHTMPKVFKRLQEAWLNTYKDERRQTRKGPQKQAPEGQTPAEQGPAKPGLLERMFGPGKSTSMPTSRPESGEPQFVQQKFPAVPDEELMGKSKQAPAPSKEEPAAPAPAKAAPAKPADPTPAIAPVKVEPTAPAKATPPPPPPEEIELQPEDVTPEPEEKPTETKEPMVPATVPSELSKQIKDVGGIKLTAPPYAGKTVSQAVSEAKTKEDVEELKKTLSVSNPEILPIVNEQVRALALMSNMVAHKDDKEWLAKVQEKYPTLYPIAYKAIFGKEPGEEKKSNPIPVEKKPKKEKAPAKEAPAKEPATAAEPSDEFKISEGSFKGMTLPQAAAKAKSQPGGQNMLLRYLKNSHPDKWDEAVALLKGKKEVAMRDPKTAAAAPGPHAYNAPGKDDKKDYNYRERHKQPSAHRMRFAVTRMFSTSSSDDAGYLIMDIGWNPEEFDSINKTAIRQHIMSYVKGLESDKYYHDFGILGKPIVMDLDTDAGVARVKVRSSNTRGVMTMNYNMSYEDGQPVPLRGIQ